MNKRFLFGLLAATLLPTADWAADISVSATVDKTCNYNAAPILSSVSNVTAISLATPSATVRITNPVTVSGFMQFWGFTFEIAGTCNHVSEIKLTTLNGGLKTDGPPAAGFLDRFDYTAQATFDGGGPVFLQTTGAPGASSVPAPTLTTTPFTGSLIVQVNSGIPNTTFPLKGGDYSDTLTIHLIPQ